MGVDSKLLSKLLATRLEKLLPSLINPDQTGFIQDWFSFTNVRRLLNIIQYSSWANCRAIALSLDAKKAFDRVEWEYLFDVLERFGLGGGYNSPEACVITNGMQSSPFPLHRGTRQGCPLSPLFFTLALEPLSEAIRQRQDVHGMTVGGVADKIGLYADDILLFLTKPEISIPAIVSIVHEFSSFSGYKINFGKSEAMPLGGLTGPPFPTNCPFKWFPTVFIYLGVKVTPDLKELWKLNFSPVVIKIMKDLERWHDLPPILHGVY